MTDIGLWMYQNDGGDGITQRLIAALESRGLSVWHDFDMRACHVVNGHIYTADGRDLSTLSVLYHMNADEQSAHQNDILRAIETSGVRVINGWGAFMACRDKFVANQTLRHNGIRVPDAALIPADASPAQVCQIVAQLGGHVVFKPRENHGAMGIMMFQQGEELVDFIQATKAFFASYYVERYIPFGDHDYRVEIFDGQVIGGYSRGKSHRFKTNVSQGGAMLPIPPSDERKAIALKAAHALGITTTIVDMIQSLADGQTYVLEVNPIMGIFVEAGMRAGTKTSETTPHPAYSNDDLKLSLICDALERAVRAGAALAAPRPGSAA